MSFIITILAALLVFSAVIAIHEFGHFTVAKLCGIQVNEFSIGMGPVLWKKNHKGTQYSLRALPVGGFVALEGEESPESQQAEAAHTVQEQPAPETETSVQPTGVPLNEAPVWQRALVMVAGAVMNFVLGFVVLVILIAAQNEPITSKTIYAIQDGALCGQTGLQAGDKVLAVNGRRCFVANDILYELVRTRSYSADFTVLRDGQKVQLPGVQFDTWHDEKGETHIVLMHYGCKRNIVRCLVKRGCKVTVMPAFATAEEIKALAPDGIMLSNGPGDPAEPVEVIENLKHIFELNIPTFGICLGHQLSALAAGAKTMKLKYGHRGANQPVTDFESGRTFITSQNHGYAVVGEELPAEMGEVAQVNANDGTCEGIKYKKWNCFTVQFHPEANGGPKDTEFLFDRFLNNVKAAKEAR